MGKKRSKNLAKNIRLLEQAMEDVEAEVLEKSDEAKELARRIKSIKSGGGEKPCCMSEEVKDPLRRGPQYWMGAEYQIPVETETSDA